MRIYAKISHKFLRIPNICCTFGRRLPLAFPRKYVRTFVRWKYKIFVVTALIWKYWIQFWPVQGR